MRPHRKFLLVLAVVLVGGSIGWTAGYGLHLRSESYRKEVEHNLSLFFDLPCNVGRISGRTFSSRAFEDVEVWLPDRRDRVFSCRRAIWKEAASEGEPAKRLELIDGTLVLGSDRWRGDDYRQVFQSGLGHNFQDLDLSHVELSSFQILFDRGEVQVHCGDASGTVEMSDPQDGVAHLIAHELNDYRVTQGVRIDARFLPKNGVEVSEFVLALPEVPLAAIGVGPALKGNITDGRFSGRIHYEKTDERPEIWLEGVLTDADLSQLTRAVPLGPFVGRVSVDVRGARVSDSLVTHLRGRGEITGLSLASFGPLLGVPSLSGNATFKLDAVDIAVGHVNRLRLTGSLGGLVLEEWLRPWGYGSASGQLQVRVNNLDVVEDKIESADIEVTVLPPRGRPGTIQRALLLTAAEQAFNMTWPESLPRDLLPEEVEYAQFGMRLLVRDNQLRILGTHGKDGDAILTIKVWGRPLSVLKEQVGTIDLGPPLADLLSRARRADPSRVRQWWERRASDSAPE
jgi:hypothetical protein